MPTCVDGPSSPLFSPLVLQGNAGLETLAPPVISETMAAALPHAPSGRCVCWGIPFNVGRVVVLKQEITTVTVLPAKARWLVFLHTSDLRPLERDPRGFPVTKSGEGFLGEHAADYVVLYSDGSEERVAIRRRYHMGMFQSRWGENCFQAVAHRKPRPVRAHHEQPASGWGHSQTRVDPADRSRWTSWLFAWGNPHPEKEITGLRFEPKSGVIVLSAVSAGEVSSMPLRWERRHKAILRLPQGETFGPALDEVGMLAQLRLDLGQVISAAPRLLYPNDDWESTYNNRLPERSTNEILVEFTAHPEARFHLLTGNTVAVDSLAQTQEQDLFVVVPPASQRVRVRIVERGSDKAVAAKLHVHGAMGEYLAPLDRHRIPNPAWFEDYSVDFTHAGTHHCTYIPGETTIDLPMGKVYLEISKGFEIRPVRRVVNITAETKEILVELDRVLPWRDRGWVTADTHVHFLSPPSALMEGAAEGVNVVNLLASQWGELMTNVGDFDGKTTFGSHESGGDGEYLVRVGTENRQHVLGHISLLGYSGDIIAPMTTGGPDESALGDPVETLLTEWARQCRKQGGVVVLPHFPNPRSEHAAAVMGGDVDAVEMTSWGNLYGGIDPYSLVDWYRYLNCGYMVPAVGGTDKMSASTAVGTVRTYARIPKNREFTYDSWKDALRRGETFVTYGPLMGFAAEGVPPGGHIAMSSGGGTIHVDWQVASVTVPMTRVELVVNGEIRESTPVGPDQGNGSWPVRVNQSSWLALVVRGHYPDKPEIVAAHSSPIMVSIEGSPLLVKADATSILEQIEGALAYLDTVGTRAEISAYRRMRLVLTSAHRSLHNRMHRLGYYHAHTPVDDHEEHR